MSSSALARIVFALLVLSTVGAFFVTQRLKRSPPPVKRIVVPHYIAPNGGPKRIAHIRFSLPKGDYVTVSVVNPGGDEVRRLLDDGSLARGVHRFVWNGHDASGRVPPDGLYFVRIVLHGQGRAVTSPRGMELVTRPPAARIVSVAPARLTPERAASVTVRFVGPANPPARFTVYRTDDGPAHAVASFAALRGAHSAEWDARVQGRPAPAGLYSFAVTVRNRALIPGSAPRRLPPTRAEATRASGLTISGPAAAGPLEPVSAGGVEHIALSGASGPVGYSVVRVGAHHPLSTGSGQAPDLAIPLSGRARTGLYELELRAAAGTARFPLAVRAATRAAPRILVLLPTLSWQADNPLDGDADGFADTLDGGASVALTRPFAFGRPPPDFEQQAAPLLRFLDSQHLSYDLTTDIALVRGRGPALAGHRGLVLAGSERWTTAAFDAQLRSYVESGGSVVSFGSDALRRDVRLSGDRLSALGAPAQQNALGERTSPSGSAAAPLVVGPDSLGLFTRTTGYVGLFTRFEQSDGLPATSKLESAAGRDPAHPSFVAYTLGRGLVVRTGTPQWSAALASDAQISNVTAALWPILSR